MLKKKKKKSFSLLTNQLDKVQLLIQIHIFFLLWRQCQALHYVQLLATVSSTLMHSQGEQEYRTIFFVTCQC